MRAPRVALSWLVASMALCSHAARAQDSVASEAAKNETTESAAARAPLAPSAPLEPLPTPPNIRLAEPNAEDVELLNGLLDRLLQLTGPDPETSARALLEVDPTLLPAIKARIDTEAEKSQRSNLKQLLIDTRKATKAATKRGAEEETPDYLFMMLSRPAPDNSAWQQLVRILALSRMCTHLGTVEAVRVLIHIYVRFEFLRIDTQLQMNALGDKALAGLIEATRHQAPSVSEWAKRRLDFLGKAIPSEVVQVQDPQVVADVLRAYGRVKDPDAPRLIISFAGSERSQIREAARQAVALLGEVGNWPLRDSYEDMVGKKPPREWTWDRTARELFKNLDQIRWAELYEHYQRGLDAQSAGKLEEMKDAFDKVLARRPDFEPKDKLVEGYFSYVTERFDTDAAGVSEALQRLIRIAPTEGERARAQSLALTLHARSLKEKNVADQFQLQRAKQLEPGNEHAQELLGELSQEPLTETTGFMRLLWPLSLGAVSLLAALIVALRRRQEPAQTNPGVTVDTQRVVTAPPTAPPAPPPADDLDEVLSLHPPLEPISTQRASAPSSVPPEEASKTSAEAPKSDAT